MLGPGLGRSDIVLTNARNVVEQVKARHIPLVIDAVSTFAVLLSTCPLTDCCDFGQVNVDHTCPPVQCLESSKCYSGKFTNTDSVNKEKFVEAELLYPWFEQLECCQG